MNTATLTRRPLLHLHTLPKVEITMAYQSVNPNTGKVLQSFAQMSSTQLEKSLAAAEHCFESWKKKSYAERAVIINKAAALLHAHVDDFAKLETLEMGKRIDEARGEVRLSADIWPTTPSMRRPSSRRPSCIRGSEKRTWKSARWACCSASSPGTSRPSSMR